MPVSEDDFRLALSRFATGVTVMTTRIGDVVHGMTANSFASVSLEPRLVLVCVKQDAAMHPLVTESGSFAANILSEGQEELSVWFSSAERPVGEDQFGGIRWHPAPGTGAPVLDGSLAHVDCEVRDVHAAGTHSIFIGEVVGTDVDPTGRPLLYYGSDYHRLPHPRQ